MPNYPGKRKGTRRIVIWAKLEGESRSKPHEWVVEGSRADGEAFEAAKKIELNRLRRVEIRTAPSFSDFCVRHYAPHAETHLKASTWGVRVHVLATLQNHFGRIKLSEVSVADVERYKAVRNVDPSTVNAELRVFRTVLNYASTLGVPVPVLKWKKLPERGKGRVRVWTRDEVEALFASAREHAPELVPVLVFLLNTGCRKGEALACEWSWIDFENDMIRIPATKFWSPKNGKPREVPMSDAVRAVLAGTRKHARWVFPSAWGCPYVAFPHGAYWAARNGAGLRGGVHTTRHTFASHFLAATKDLSLLAEVLGHSSTKVTELYAHMLPGRLDEARNAVNLAPTLALEKRLKKVT